MTCRVRRRWGADDEFERWISHDDREHLRLCVKTFRLWRRARAQKLPIGTGIIVGAIHQPLLFGRADWLSAVLVQHCFDGAMAVVADAPDQWHGRQGAAAREAQRGEDGDQAYQKAHDCSSSKSHLYMVNRQSIIKRIGSIRTGTAGGVANRLHQRNLVVMMVTPVMVMMVMTAVMMMMPPVMMMEGVMVVVEAMMVVMMASMMMILDRLQQASLWFDILQRTGRSGLSRKCRHGQAHRAADKSCDERDLHGITPWYVFAPARHIPWTVNTLR